MLPNIQLFGLSISTYYSSYVIGFVIMMILNIKKHDDYRITKLRAVIYTLVTYVLGVGGAMIMALIYNYLYSLRDVEGEGRVAIFGAIVFTPLMLIGAVALEKLFRKVFKIQPKEKTEWKRGERPRNKSDRFYSYSFRDTIDLLTPGIFIILTCAKFGCFLQGCCYGMLCEHGIYNNTAEHIVFPVQICEALSMTAVLVAVFIIRKKGLLKPGMAFPVTTALYVITRFVWEFFRYYDDKVKHFWGFMTVTQGFCVVLLIASCISVLCIYMYSKKDRSEKQ